MWYINIQHWLDETKTKEAVTKLRLKVKKLSEIITYATSDLMNIPVDSSPKCWRRPSRKPCTGIFQVDFDLDTDQIVWFCDVCGDEGAISGWQGLIWDMTDKETDTALH